MNHLEPLRRDEEDELLAKVPEQWHEDFLAFIKKGDASDEFLAFLDKDLPTQQAVEAAFAEQVRNFERFADELNINPEIVSAHLNEKKVGEGEGIQERSSSLRRVISGWASLQPIQLHHLLRELAASVPRRDVSKFIADLTNNLRSEE